MENNVWLCVQGDLDLWNLGKMDGSGTMVPIVIVNGSSRDGCGSVHMMMRGEEWKMGHP
jgi:hypothetical protein